MSNRRREKFRQMREQRERDHQCAFSDPDAIGVRAALENLLHYHLMHTCNRFSGWATPVIAQQHRPADQRATEAEVIIISDPKLLERVRKVLEIPTAEPEATIH